MAGVPPWLGEAGVVLGVIIAIRPAFKTIHWLWVKILNGAQWISLSRKALSVILTELVPNGGASIKDKADKAVEIGLENQRALENHLLDHHHAGRRPPPDPDDIGGVVF